MTDQAHRELDFAVAVHVFGVDPKKTPATMIDTFSADMAAAWKVHEKACGWIFSKRQRYYDHLRAYANSIVNPEGGRIDWPDVLTALQGCMPEAICRAALATAVPPPPPAKPEKRKSNEVRGMLGREL